MILLIARFLGALSSYGRAGQIAFAMGLGVTLALIPGGTLLWVVLFVPLMLVRMNQAALLGTMGVFRLLAPLYDPFSEELGHRLLTADALTAPMGRLLSLPFVGWFRLDDSFVTGGFVLGLVSIPVCFVLFLLLVGLYRRFLAGKVKAVFRRIGAKVPWIGRFAKAVGAARGGLV